MVAKGGFGGLICVREEWLVRVGRLFGFWLDDLGLELQQSLRFPIDYNLYTHPSE